MKERPILFSAAMVRAILDGRKTQTRRLVKPQPTTFSAASGMLMLSVPGAMQSWNAEAFVEDRCPYGRPGDRLYVKEAHAFGEASGGLLICRYPADGEARIVTPPLEFRPVQRRSRPSIHMPRWASRITLELTDVRIERVQEISESDAVAEGVTHYQCGHPDCIGPKGESGSHYGPRGAFMELWDSINAKKAPWSSNPWVWVVSFRPEGLR